MTGNSPPPVLFIGFWGATDGLTTSTILPGVRLLLEEFGVPRVFLATVERGALTAPAPMPGLVHVPWMARASGIKVVDRARDQIGRVRQLCELVRRERIGLIMARTSPAGAHAEAVSRRTGVPFVVESFEPHADYMADCGEWKRGGILYRSLHRMEEHTIARARYLLVVAQRYREHLERRGVAADRIVVVPCPVELDRFRVDPAARERMRAELRLADARVGIYVGKFGGLYHREEAFRMFAATHRHLQGRFKLIVLTPDPPEEVRTGLVAAGFPTQDAWVGRVPHESVPDHLNAADFGFAPYKRTPSSGFLSPVKVGEYWATGLPVLLTRDVGDEGDIMEREGLGGALFDPEKDDLPVALDAILDRSRAPGHREAIRQLAVRYRSLDHARGAYARVMASLVQSPR